MKRSLIVISVLALFVFAAGCASNKGQAAPPAEKKSDGPIPFGLTLKWKVEDILGDKAWQDVAWEDIRCPHQGILVKEVLSGRQAQEKEFKPGDIIYAVDKKRFKDTGDFIRLLYKVKPGNPISFYVIRDEGGSKKLLDLYMSIPTYGYSDWNFLIFYGHHRSEYVKRTHVLSFLFYDNNLFACRTLGVMPFYHSERIGKVKTQRIFWFFKWRTGVEEEFTI
jgi:hypothetical protein